MLRDTLAQIRGRRGYRFHRLLARHRWRLRASGESLRLRLQRHYPRFVNEGMATAHVVDSTFRGLPLPEHYADKLEAVMHLQLIWDVLDDLGDGRRINVHRAHEGLAELRDTYRRAYERRSGHAATYWRDQ